MSVAPSTALDALTKALLKRLANSHDGFDRARAVRIVGRWLRTRATLDTESLLRIWRGLFYCFWMSDKVPVQQQLAADLADMMLPPLPTDRAMLLLRTFLHTLQREWTSIDQLRMDKFMTLVRRFVHRGFLVVAKKGWDKDEVEQLTEMYIEPEGATLAHDSVARGFFLHVTDTWLPELERAAADAHAADPNVEALHFDAVNTLLTPFYHIVALCRDQSMVERVQKEVFTPLLQLAHPPAQPRHANSKRKRAAKAKDDEDDDDDMEESEDEEEEEEEEDDSIAAQFPHLHAALQGSSLSIAATFHALASAKDDAITSRSRKSLYSWSAQFRAVDEQSQSDDEEAEEAEAARQAERAVAQKQAAARQAAKQQKANNKKRKAEEAALEGEGDDATQLAPGVGSEGLAALVKERAKKKNKKQRLADKRRKAEALLGAEPGKQAQQQQQQGGQQDDEDDEEDDEDLDESAFAELGSDEELEFAELGSGEDIEEEDEDAEMEMEDDEEEDPEEIGSDEAEESSDAPAVPALSAKEAKRLAQALEAKKQQQQKKQQQAGGKKKIVPVAVNGQSDAPTTPPKAQQQQAKQRKAAAAVVPAAAPAAAAAPAFLTPQPSKKSVSHTSPGRAGAASKQLAATCIKAAAAPPSSTKKNVQIVLANNKVREFKRWARDSISVETPVLLAKPSPRSAIKPESIAFFLQHNKNGKELAAKRQQALAQQFNDAADEDDDCAAANKSKGRTPPVSPRSKAADFF